MSVSVADASFSVCHSWSGDNCCGGGYKGSAGGGEGSVTYAYADGEHNGLRTGDGDKILDGSGEGGDKLSSGVLFLLTGDRDWSGDEGRSCGEGKSGGGDKTLDGSGEGGDKLSSGIMGIRGGTGGEWPGNRWQGTSPGNLIGRRSGGASGMTVIMRGADGEFKGIRRGGRSGYSCRWYCSELGGGRHNRSTGGVGGMTVIMRGVNGEFKGRMLGERPGYCCRWCCCGLGGDRGVRSTGGVGKTSRMRGEVEDIVSAVLMELGDDMVVTCEFQVRF